MDAVNKYVHVSLNQNEFDALVSFVFSNSPGNAKKGFARSTLLQLLNSGDYWGAANEFDRWIYSLRQKSNGLINRRADEKNMILKDFVVTGDLYCFPAATPIQTSLTSTTPISASVMWSWHLIRIRSLAGGAGGQAGDAVVPQHHNGMAEAQLG